jgi:large subunit ribosomal protein L7/L12
MNRCIFCDHKNSPAATRCEKCGAELAGLAEQPQEPVDDTLMDLIRRGQKINAIKLYRERTGLGLKEAKDAVEALERGESTRSPKNNPTELQEAVVSLLRNRQKIQAIKLFRDQTGVGLADAKQAVEELAATHGIPDQKFGCAGVVLSLIVVTILATAMLL